MSAVCFCRFLVPNPILCAEFLYRIPAARYARDFLLLNLATISSEVSSPFLIFSTTCVHAFPPPAKDLLLLIRERVLIKSDHLGFIRIEGDLLFAADGTHKDRQWTVRNVIERLAAIRREKIAMGTVEFEKVTTPEPDQQTILDYLKVRL